MKKELSIFGLAEEMEAFYEMMEMDQGEVTTESEELWKSLQVALTEKTDSYHEFVQHLADREKAVKENKKRIDTVLKVIKKAKERMSENVINCFQRMEISEIKGELSSIKLRKPAQVLEVIDEHAIPDEFASFVRVVDTAAVKKALKAGQEVPGAKLKDGKTSVMYKYRTVK